jgi:hypothetical protein
MSKIPFATVALLLAVPLSAQTASYTYVDQKAPYTGPAMPFLIAANLPKLGTTFKVQVHATGSDRWCAYQTFLAFGATNPDFAIPALNGLAFCSAEVVLPTPGTSLFPMVVMSFPIPNAPALLGLKFYQQSYMQRSCRPFFIRIHELSRGGVGVIGR